MSDWVNLRTLLSNKESRDDLMDGRTADARGVRRVAEPSGLSLADD
jgi:hypothetical protein